MDGKVDAEALVAQVLADPALMRTLGASPNANVNAEVDVETAASDIATGTGTQPGA